MQSFLCYIYPVGMNFAPRTTMFCAGQLLPISAHDAVFSLLGTTYGGDGRTTFGLPNLICRAPIGSIEMGSNTLGLAPVRWGAMGGQQHVYLNVTNLPPHTHAATFTPAGGGTAAVVQVALDDATLPSAGLSTTNPTNGDYLALPVDGGSNSGRGFVKPAEVTNTFVLGGVSGDGSGGGVVTIGATGAGSQVDTQSPFTGVNYVIAMEGIYPSRN